MKAPSLNIVIRIQYMNLSEVGGHNLVYNIISFPSSLNVAFIVNFFLILIMKINISIFGINKLYHQNSSLLFWETQQKSPTWFPCLWPEFHAVSFILYSCLQELTKTLMKSCYSSAINLINKLVNISATVQNESKSLHNLQLFLCNELHLLYLFIIHYPLSILYHRHLCCF